MADIVHINPAGRDISGDERATCAIAEPLQRSLACSLGFVAMQGFRVDARSCKHLCNPISLVLGPGENDDLLEVRV